VAADLLLDQLPRPSARFPVELLHGMVEAAKTMRKRARRRALSNNRTSEGRNMPNCSCKSSNCVSMTSGRYLRRRSAKISWARSNCPGGTTPSKASGVRIHCWGGLAWRGVLSFWLVRL